MAGERTYLADELIVNGLFMCITNVNFDKETIVTCGKFRFNDLDLGTIGDIPRILDVGQCNDAYGAVQIALAPAKAFDCEVSLVIMSLIFSLGTMVLLQSVKRLRILQRC